MLPIKCFQLDTDIHMDLSSNHWHNSWDNKNPARGSFVLAGNTIITIILNWSPNKYLVRSNYRHWNVDIEVVTKQIIPLGGY